MLQAILNMVAEHPGMVSGVIVMLIGELIRLHPGLVSESIPHLIWNIIKDVVDRLSASQPPPAP